MKNYKLTIKINDADSILEFKNLTLEQAIKKLGYVAKGFVLNLENLKIDEVKIQQD